MRTRRAISTISYNTDTFLEAAFNDMVLLHKISFWTYINHVPDEEVGKNHKHIYLIPDRQIDTSNISLELEEFDPSNPLPLKCMTFRYSKFDDWYLYSLHDKDYLKFKGKERHTFYNQSDFRSSDNDYLSVLIHNIDTSPYSGYSSLINAYYAGESFADLIERGKIPLHRISQFATVWKALSQKNIAGIDYGNTEIITGEIKNYEKYKEVI